MDDLQLRSRPDLLYPPTARWNGWGRKCPCLIFPIPDRQKGTCTVFRKFLAQEKLSIIPMHNLDHAYYMNDHFDTFMVGSDQVWNPGFLGSLFFLDFAKGEKRKIAYGPSMARHDKPSERYLRKISRLLKRFDPISVREQGMVDHLRQHFGCGQHLGHGPRIPAQPGAVA